MRNSEFPIPSGDIPGCLKHKPATPSSPNGSPTHRKHKTIVDSSEPSSVIPSKHSHTYAPIDLLETGKTPVDGSGNTDSSLTCKQNILPDDVLRKAFNEITFKYRGLHIGPISPLTSLRYTKSGYAPTRPIIIEDDISPAEIIRTMGGWVAFTGPGTSFGNIDGGGGVCCTADDDGASWEYVCFVTADDEKLLRILADKGPEWADEAEGVWKGRGISG